MARVNEKAVYNGPKTHEGGIAKRVSARDELERSMMACMLWENTFYENGQDVAQRIAALTQAVSETDARSIMYASKKESKLRHAPLWMAVAMARVGRLKAEDLDVLITRADDITEFLAMYWKDGKVPISKQVKLGLAKAFHKFNEYQLAKYNRATDIKLKDVLRLVHPAPNGDEESALWKRLLADELATPDTWEVALSAGKDKKATFERLLAEGSLGDLAFLRNLRKMEEVDVDPAIIKDSFKNRNWKYILPFQFVTAARYAPRYEPQLEEAMLACMANAEKTSLPVTLLVDSSGSMSASISLKSEQTRLDVGAGLAILAREYFSDLDIAKFDNMLNPIPARRGFALRDAIGRPGGGTRMWDAIQKAEKEFGKKDILIVLTDEQTEDDPVGRRIDSDLVVIVNIASNQYGVTYSDRILHVNGWSENVLKYILKYVESRQR